MGQVVEHLPRNCKALNSIPKMTERGTEREEEGKKDRGRRRGVREAGGEGGGRERERVISTWF
jgi:hypothetical protein